MEIQGISGNLEDLREDGIRVGVVPGYDNFLRERSCHYMTVVKPKVRAL